MQLQKDILKGVKILDFTTLLPGPLATYFLAEMGAEVTKIIRKGKVMFTKHQAPFINGESIFYAALNDNKTTQAIDLKEEREKVLELVRQADVLIEQFRPKTMKYWGLSYEELKEINPSLIYLSLTGYGQTGKYAQKAGHDLNYLAETGLLSLNKDINNRPVIPGVQMADIAGGSFQCVSAILAALYQKATKGIGAYIDLAMVDAVFPLGVLAFTQHWGGLDSNTIKILHGGLCNYNVYQCKDDQWIALGALELKFWNTFCGLAEREDWERKDLLALSIHIFPQDELITFFKTKTRDEWIVWAGDTDICLSPILEVHEVEATTLAKDRQFIKDYTSQQGNELKNLELPFKLYT